MLSRETRRRLRRVLLVVGVGVAAVAAIRLPWSEMYRQILGAEPRLLLVAAIFELAAVVVKGTSWYALLRGVHPVRWLTTQDANFAGAAVNALSVSVAGEAARVHAITRLEGVSVGLAAAAVAWQRVIEAVGYAAFLLIVPFLLPLPPVVRQIQIAVAVMAAAVLLLSLFKGWRNTLLGRVGFVARALDRLGEIRSSGRLRWPILLALVNWALLWAGLHLTLLATQVEVSLAASFTAVIAGDLAGSLRLTPGNIGVTQGALAAALLPFGVPPYQAVAAGIVLQAIQVPPVLAVTGGLAAWKKLSSGPWPMPRS